MPELYIETRNGVPVAYRYGEEIEAAKLWVEGGYPTPRSCQGSLGAVARVFRYGVLR